MTQEILQKIGLVERGGLQAVSRFHNTTNCHSPEVHEGTYEKVSLSYVVIGIYRCSKLPLQCIQNALLNFIYSIDLFRQRLHLF